MRKMKTLLKNLLLKNSWIIKRKFFDKDYYLSNNLDVANANINPFKHFMNIGWKEFRNPSKNFNTKYYLLNNSDVVESGVNPLLHYVNFGIDEGRRVLPRFLDNLSCDQVELIIKGSGLFDAEYYLKVYSDVRNAGVDPLKHYVASGASEGRNPSADFDSKYYCSSNPEVIFLQINPLFHYIEIGRLENRATKVRLPDVDEAYKRSLTKYIATGQESAILLTSHDLSKSGAPLLLLHIAKNLKQKQRKSLIVLTMMGGDLEDEFRKYCYVINLKQSQIAFLDDLNHIEGLFGLLHDLSVFNAIANTVSSGLYIPYFEKYGLKYQILIHEMPGVLANMQWNSTVIPLIKNMQSDLGSLIFSSEFVAQSYKEQYGINCSYKIISQGMFQEVENFNRSEARTELRNMLQIPQDSLVIFSGGKDFYRKGADIFFELSQSVNLELPDCYFVFLGSKEDPRFEVMVKDLKNTNYIFLDFMSDYRIFLKGADLYALTSREDPLPNMLLDAISFGIPTIAFDGCGGASEILSQLSDNLLAKKLNIDDYREKLLKLLKNEFMRAEIHNVMLEFSKEKFNFDIYVQKLCDGLDFSYFMPYFVKQNYNDQINKKKALHFIGNFNVGGSSRLVIDLVEEIDEFSHTVFTQYIPSPQKYVGVDISLVNVYNVDELKEKITLLDPSIIHVHYWGRADHAWYSSVYDALEKLNYPVIQNINVSVEPLINHINKSYIYVSEFVKNNFPSDNRSKETVIYPGSDFTLFKSRDLSKDNYEYEYIGMVYRLDKDKINEDSIDPMLELAKLSPKVKFMIVGDGELLDVYKLKVASQGFTERFLFTGYVSYKELPQLYNKMSVYIAPVFDESFGQVTPFAMNVGMPVVGYDVGAISEIINNVDLLAPKGDARSLALICKDLLDDKSKMLKIAHANQICATTKFSLNQMIQAYRKVYFAHAVKRKLNILIVALNKGAQQGGGADVIWHQLALRMLAMGSNVTLSIWSRKNISNIVTVLANEGVEVDYFGETDTKILEKHRWDLAILIQGDHNEGVPWFFACKKRDISYVIVNQLTKEGFWPDDSQALAIKESYLSARKVFFTCEQNRLLMERQLGVKLNNAGRHYNPITIDDVELNYPDTSHGYCLAYPARLIVIHKGQDILFEVLKQDKWKNRNLIINLYGDGENKKQLEALKEYYGLSNINFCAYESSVENIWKNNHGLILTSRMEGVPLVLLGAMMCSRVSILTDVGGHAEVIQNGVSGFIANAVTVSSIDAALEKAWIERDSWRKMGIEAKKRVLELMPSDPIKDFMDKLI